MLAAIQHLAKKSYTYLFLLSSLIGCAGFGDHKSLGEGAGPPSRGLARPVSPDHVHQMIAGLPNADEIAIYREPIANAGRREVAGKGRRLRLGKRIEEQEKGVFYTTVYIDTYSSSGLLEQSREALRCWEMDQSGRFKMVEVLDESGNLRARIYDFDGDGFIDETEQGKS